MQQRGLHAWNVSCASEAPQQRCLTAARQISVFKLRRCAGFACLGLHDAGLHTIRAYTYLALCKQLQATDCSTCPGG